MDPNARGSVFGITRGTTREDFIKATLQSLAYQSRDVIDTMKKDSGIDIPSIRVDGGASNNDYLMQFQSDILGIEIDRASDLETTALGAAFLAGLAVGFWKDLEDLKKEYKPGKVFKPKMSTDEREDLYTGWQEAVAATRQFKHRPRQSK